MDIQDIFSFHLFNLSETFHWYIQPLEFHYLLLWNLASHSFGNSFLKNNTPLESSTGSFCEETGVFLVSWNCVRGSTFWQHTVYFYSSLLEIFLSYPLAYHHSKHETKFTCFGTLRDTLWGKLSFMYFFIQPTFIECLNILALRQALRIPRLNNT